MYLPRHLDWRGCLGVWILTCAILVVALRAFRNSSFGDRVTSALILFVVWLLYKNSMARSDAPHIMPFFLCVPLIIVFWDVAGLQHRLVEALLALCLLGASAELGAHHRTLSFASWLPAGYVKGIWESPFQQDKEALAKELRKVAPPCSIPQKIRSLIGGSSVDVMPWDSNLAILNDLNLNERPALQSYAAFTPWLDERDASFLSSSNAPPFILYVASSGIVDNRIELWDESITRRSLIENYTPAGSFDIMEMASAAETPERQGVIVLQKSPGCREFEPVSTNQIVISPGEKFNIPATTNYQFLWLDVERSALGKLQGMADRVSPLSVEMEYSDGKKQTSRAILPVLKTGVLLNYRVQTTNEFQGWLAGDLKGNAMSRSLVFKTTSAWAFHSPFKGEIVTYRLNSRAISKGDQVNK
jgi:hypothetical protein